MFLPEGKWAEKPRHFPRDPCSLRCVLFMKATVSRSSKLGSGLSSIVGCRSLHKSSSRPSNDKNMKQKVTAAVSLISNVKKKLMLDWIFHLLWCFLGIDEWTLMKAKQTETDGQRSGGSAESPHSGDFGLNSGISVSFMCEVSFKFPPLHSFLINTEWAGPQSQTWNVK